MGQSILLLESEVDVIKDVSCSLQLVDIPVIEAKTVAEAKERISLDSPILILARNATSEDGEAAVSLARELAKDPERASIPLLLVCTASEKNAMEQDLGLFDGQVSLPVEFPVTVNQIMGFLEKKASGSPEKVEEEIVVEKKGVPEVIPQNSAVADINNENMLIAYGVQMAVLEELKKSSRFRSVPKEKIPEVVATVTHKICRSFDPGKIIV